jgi:D-inositol-3-phosphate glycosyltransferase
VGGLLDEPLRSRRMGAAASIAARRFGWDATVDALLEVYTDALADRVPRPAVLRPEPVPLPVGNLAVAP